MPRRPRGPGGERLDEALVQRIPALAPLVQGLRLRLNALAPIHYRALLRLGDRYGEPAFLEAPCARSSIGASTLWRSNASSLRTTRCRSTTSPHR
ncbi:MAG: hypothetical protein JW751_30075 [Polyangiaceae bacterium]|nr:hypothetical protein [Polyangiaceae bacterium]